MTTEKFKTQIKITLHEIRSTQFDVEEHHKKESYLDGVRRLYDKGVTEFKSVFEKIDPFTDWSSDEKESKYLKKLRAENCIELRWTFTYQINS